MTGFTQKANKNLFAKNPSLNNQGLLVILSGKNSFMKKKVVPEDYHSDTQTDIFLKATIILHVTAEVLYARLPFRQIEY